MSSTRLSDNHPLAVLPTPRKVFLLFVFCFAQFLDSFNTAALFSAIPPISAQVGLNNSESVWLNSSYRLTFASFLLVSGRMSDLYSPKKIFLTGIFPICFLSIGLGFTRNKELMLVLRALSGIGAALTIPSSLHLVVHMFPEPATQAKAVGAFGGSGALGNLLGVVIGALLVSFASWPWVYWTVALMAFATGVTCTMLIPPHIEPREKVGSYSRFQRLDLFGASMLTTALILFIFAVTSGSTDGWATATVLVPLFISVILFAGYFIWEAKIPEERASLPPRMWSYTNFAVLVPLALLPYSWWSTVYLLFSWWWQDVFYWSSIKSAIHFLPIALFGFPCMAISVALSRKFPAKRMLLAGLIIQLIGTIFLPFGDSESRYWPVVFPGFMLGTAGTTIVFSSTNVAIFAITPPEVAGTVGAIFNCALQLGAATYSAIATSIQTSVQSSPTSYDGRAAGFEFLLAGVAVEALAVLVCFRQTRGFNQDTGIEERTESEIELKEGDTA